jgi:hypothetical protein
VRNIFLASALAAAVLAAGSVTSQAGCCPAVPCQIPVTKAYKIKPGFCPQALVCMIPGAVGPGCDCCDCGPYGIPPIFAAGQNVVVRQTPEMQERVAEFLTDLGAIEPKKTK